eukprot:13209185-Alexandrium_andersonii.AAC.1
MSMAPQLAQENSEHGPAARARRHGGLFLPWPRGLGARPRQLAQEGARATREHGQWATSGVVIGRRKRGA